MNQTIYYILLIFLQFFSLVLVNLIITVQLITNQFELKRLSTEINQGLSFDVNRNIHILIIILIFFYSLTYINIKFLK